MNQPPIFNWSLKTAVAAVHGNFLKARFKIIFFLLVFSLIKAIVVVIVGSIHQQDSQVIRGGTALVLYIILAKLLLYRPSLLRPVTHIMLVTGTLIVISNVYFVGDINIITLQFIFMMMLGSFYALGSGWGIWYSIVGASPVVFFLLFEGKTGRGAPEELASPGFEILAILNFATIAVAHYLFFRAFQDNVREKEALNAQLQTAVAEAQRLADTRVKFLSTISHELRTPLNAVIGVTELLVKEKPVERQREHLDILQSSSQDLLSLINNVLDYNKVDAAYLQLEKTAFQPAALLRQLCSVLKFKAAQKHLQLIADIDESLEDTWVNSDPTRLSQVIYNLAGNAIKFTEKGSVQISMRRVSGSTDQTIIAFSVTDTGIGIDPQHHGVVFEWFSQAETNTTRRFGGTGLGLAIVRQLLSLFSSEIQLQSTPGQGSRFSFSICFDNTPAPAKAEENNKAANLGHLKLLIADDDEVNRTILRRQLEHLDLSPVMVEDGDAAIQALLDADFDAVLLDLNMPVMDGYAATKQIRSFPDPRKAGTYLVAFTASVTDQEHISAAGFDAYLCKPVTMNDLGAVLEAVARTKNKQAEIVG